MKKSDRPLVLLLLLLLLGNCGLSGETKKGISSSSAIECKDYSWEKVQQLVQPWFDEFLYAQLVMQGQSSNYKVSAAANHALGMEEDLPEEVRVILNSLVEADC